MILWRKWPMVNGNQLFKAVVGLLFLPSLIQAGTITINSGAAGVQTLQAGSGVTVTNGSGPTATVALDLTSTNTWSANQNFSSSTSVRGMYFSSVSIVNVANYTVQPNDNILIASCPANTSMTITLSAASTKQSLTIYKGDKSTQTVTIVAAGSDTILVSTTQIILAAPNGNALLIGDGGTNWFSPNFKPYPPYIGVMSDAGGTVAPSANGGRWLYQYIDQPVVLKGLAFNVVVTSNTGQSDVGVYDVNGNLLTSVGATANQASAARIEMDFANPLYLNPGIFGFYFATNNAIATFESQTTQMVSNCFSYTTSFPSPSTLTVPGTNASKCTKLIGITYFPGGSLP